VPWDVVESVPLLWVTGTGVSIEPARATQRKILETRGRREHTVLDPRLPPDVLVLRGPGTGRDRWMLDHVTVAVGNRAEAEVAVGTADRTRPPTGCWPAAAARGHQEGRRGRAGRNAGGPLDRCAATDRGRLRARRRRRLRRRADPRAAVRLGPGAHRRVRQRGGRAGGVPAGLRDAMPTASEIEEML